MFISPDAPVIYIFFLLNFSKAIDLLGEENFEKVHNYLIEQRNGQRTGSTFDDRKITDDLAKFVKKPGDCFLVDQLVFLELSSN